MSLLVRSATRRAVRPSPILTVASTRLFATTPSVSKGPVEAAKETAKKVDRTVSDAAVSGIEAGESAAAKAKEMAGVKTGEAKGKAAELKGQANKAAADLQAKAKREGSDLN